MFQRPNTNLDQTNLLLQKINKFQCIYRVKKKLQRNVSQRKKKLIKNDTDV